MIFLSIYCFTIAIILLSVLPKSVNKKKHNNIISIITCMQYTYYAQYLLQIRKYILI